MYKRLVQKSFSIPTFLFLLMVLFEKFTVTFFDIQVRN